MPSRNRFKIGTVTSFLRLLLTSVEFIFQKNKDFHSLTNHDQLLLLQRSLKQVAGLAACFTLRASNLYDEAGFQEKIITIYGAEAINSGCLASTLFDSDINIVKLFLSMMIFSTLDCTYHLQRNVEKLKDIRSIQKIQDRYIEIAWKYLLYHYNLKRAVKCFSNFIRCVLIDIHSLVSAAETVDFHFLMDSVAQDTERALRIHD